MTAQLLGAIALVLAAACAGAPSGPRTTDDWARARQVAEAYLRTKYGPPPAWTIHRELSGAPYAFSVLTADQPVVIVVHAGRVIDARGTGALDRFLHESGCVAAGTVTVDELLALLQAFDAYPPHRNAQGEPAPLDFFRSKFAPAGLRPSLHLLGGGRAQLALRYRDSSTGDAPGAGPYGEMTVDEWTLTIDPTVAPLWTHQQRTWDSERAQFVSG